MGAELLSWLGGQRKTAGIPLEVHACTPIARCSRHCYFSTVRRDDLAVFFSIHVPPPSIDQCPHQGGHFFVVAVSHGKGRLTPVRVPTIDYLEPFVALPWLTAAARCATAAKLPAFTWPPFALAVADWMRAAAWLVIGVDLA